MNRSRNRPLALVVALLAAGASVMWPAHAQPGASAMTDDAAAGVLDPALRSLVSDHWSWTMSRWPTWASRLGDHRYDDRLEDLSPAAFAADRSAREGFARRAARLSRRRLSPDDRTTLELLRTELDTGLATDACHTEQWGLSARNNPLVALGMLAEGVDLSPPNARSAYLARLRAFPVYAQQDADNLRAGIASGRTPDADAVSRVIAQLDAALSAPADGWSVVSAVPAGPTRDEARALVDAALGPALRAYRDFLSRDLLPASRGPDRAGVWALPDGDACYAALAARETSLSLSPDDIHAVGLRELEAIHAELRELGARALGTSDLPAILDRLRSDPALRFRTEEEVEAAAVSAVSDASAVLPRVFSRLPAASCGVRRVPAHEAPFTTIAYYWPSVPGEEPGYYYVNTYAPETRPRFEARALAFHEAVPGHHLQIALAQELPALPAFRRHLGTTAFVEGWALYTERLADELGLYPTDLDRIGMLSFDAWRAARLVVDTGLHAKRWTRAQAEAFFLANTPLAENNVRNEVDRYITWPGQALAYKLGQIEIRALRQEAETALGPRFSLPAFHEAVLGGGAVTLPALRARVEAWVASVPSGP
jgi:uncharacterized protein (DUF885 family)